MAPPIRLAQLDRGLIQHTLPTNAQGKRMSEAFADMAPDNIRSIIIEGPTTLAASDAITALGDNPLLDDIATVCQAHGISAKYVSLRGLRGHGTKPKTPKGS